jgi:(p)ppGpp synthase/HD superfamily hydrolase
VHLASVEEVLVRFGVATLARRVAAWFHDAKEDQGVSDKQLTSWGLTSQEVAIVDGVTSEPGSSRKLRNALTYQKTARHADSVILKLADRIANIEACLRDSNDRLLTMYRMEYNNFRAALFGPGLTETGVKEMWAYLDSLVSNPSSQVR